ncbi:type III-A CRISPR-associated protein Csm2 [Desulfolithobacter sp.]
MATITLWKDKQNRLVDPYLFSRTADELAKRIHQEGLDHRGREKKNSSSQLRRFFDEITRLNIKAQDDVEPWELIMPQVHMMVAKVAYAKGRDLVTDSFVSLFGDTIRDQVKDKDDLQTFTSFFETFIGFYKSYRKK